MSTELSDLTGDNERLDDDLLSSPKHKRARLDYLESTETEMRLVVEADRKEEPIAKTTVDEVEQEPPDEEGEDGNGVEDSGKTVASASAIEPQVLPPIQYEYLDHTADVQIHAWGDSITEAFEQCAMGMFAYMTDIERVDNLASEQIEAKGHDMLSLLYGFLDEWLFLFNADPNFVARKIAIISFDRENFKILAVGYGETFDLSKHTQGTEVKAITYSNMQFHEKEDYAEVFVIIDI